MILSLHTRMLDQCARVRSQSTVRASHMPVNFCDLVDAAWLLHSMKLALVVKKDQRACSHTLHRKGTAPHWTDHQ
jgi:hypothetical protein